MPIGSYSLVPYVADRLWKDRPRRVLDLGIGMGMYGAAVRQWVDLGVQPWTTYLVGVEACAEYRNPLWDLYNLVVVDTIQNYLAKNTEPFDFVIFSDVIEHFVKDEGTRLIRMIQPIISPGGHLLVGTPAIFEEQGAVHGNEFERHRSLWAASDLAELGFRVIVDGKPDAFGCRMLLADWMHSLD